MAALTLTLDLPPDTVAMLRAEAGRTARWHDGANPTHQADAAFHAQRAHAWFTLAEAIDVATGNPPAWMLAKKDAA